jgi:hypothetical protein
VTPPKLLLAILETPEAYPSSWLTNEDVGKTTLGPKLTGFCEATLAAMGSLPKDTEKAGYEALEALLRPLRRSFLVAFRVLHVVALARGEPSGLRAVRETFYGREEYKLYARLASWVYRRSPEGKAQALAYREKRVAPPKNQEAERKRASYWAKKGVPQPPPKRRYHRATPEALAAPSPTQSPPEPSSNLGGQTSFPFEDLGPLDEVV